MSENWTEYKKLVLAELERLDKGVESNKKEKLTCSKEIDGRIDKIEREIAVMAVKVWIGAGIISTIFTGLIAALIKHFGGG